MKNAVFTLAGLLLVGSANAAAPADPLSTLSGRWTWIGNEEKYGHDLACKSHWEKYQVSSDARDVSANSAKGTVAKYRVIYTEGAGSVMFRETEEQRVPSGDRTIWVMIAESPDRFRWRVYGQQSNPSEEAKFGRVRCPSS